MLFIVPGLNHGGTNRSFCNMIDLFDFESREIEIDLLCIKGKYDKTYLKEFQERNINILPENYGLSSIYNNSKKIIRRLTKKLIGFLPQNILNTIIKLSCLKYNNKYSAVVSMEEGVSTHIASYIKAPKKIVWVRCMYERYYELTHSKSETVYYDEIDSIVCVSEECQKSFISVYPQYKEKTVCIPNTQNRELILKKSKEKTDIRFDTAKYNIVSVGRLDIVKQFHLIPSIVSKLKEKGLDVTWYIIGEGSCRNQITDEATKYGVENNVILLGPKSNPYPIMSQANLVAITSISESFCNVISEGKILSKPIISTAFPAVYATMGNYSNGTICMLDDFPEKIYEIYHNKDNKKFPCITLNKEDEDIKNFIMRLEKIF